MPAIINPTITDAGLAAAVDADSNSLQVQITHVVIGAGGFTPTGSETALLDRREKVSVAAGSVAIGGALTVNLIFPAYAGASYNAREIGFYIGDPDAGGVLFAIYSDPAPLGFVARSSLEFIAQFTLGLTRVPVGSVSVTIDPQASWLFAMLEDHRIDPNAHPAYIPNSNMVGAVMGFAMPAPPAGWLRANGAAVLRGSFPALFAAVGTTYGSGDGITTYNLPDYRGMFPRGLDDGRGVDPGRLIGSVQGGQAGPHKHSAKTNFVGDHVHASRITKVGGAGSDGHTVQGSSGYTDQTQFISAAGGHDHTFVTDFAGGTETRPINMALLMCIKY